MTNVKTWNVREVFASMMLLGVGPQIAIAQVFQGLGTIGASNSSRALAISADGLGVTGGTTNFDTPWRWNAGTGLVAFTGGPAGFTLNEATGISRDGSVVVGNMNDGVFVYAWRWTQATGVQRVVGMGGFPGPYISADGSTIVGQLEGLSGGAARWTAASGAVPIPLVTGYPVSLGDPITSFAASGDGSVVVGVARVISTFPQTAVVPFRWTQSTGAVALLDNGSIFGMDANGAGASSISDDGTVIIGYSGSRAWRWDAVTGFQMIISEPSIAGTFTPSLSGDGTTVAFREFYWTQQTGRLPIATVLTNAGCNFPGWSNLFTTDVSFNGRALCGFGTNPQGQTEAWHATIPAPGAGVCIFAGAMALRRHGRVGQHGPFLPVSV